MSLSPGHGAPEELVRNGKAIAASRWSMLLLMVPVNLRALRREILVPRGRELEPERNPCS